MKGTSGKKSVCGGETHYINISNTIFKSYFFTSWKHPALLSLFLRTDNSRMPRCQTALFPVRHILGKRFLNFKPWQLCRNPVTEESLQTQQVVGTGSVGGWFLKKKKIRKCTKGHSSRGCAVPNVIHLHRMQLLRIRRQDCIHINVSV